ncbi:DapH/DapD/GlmU-related protein [Calothrix sp. PCC 7507]|uniref:acyltransferase n=1 Tax=Calothrix sp. PCC 7507 TaxID=99598 RepID=UPI00029ED056|nr:acyltransferase [Calothrix sp. PCC 7507]AFY33733.1 hexapeptide repeat-containing transferase [Calothrix sp. PCC 7507]
MLKKILGAKVINMLCRNIFTQLGSTVYIKNAVGFVHDTYVEIWNASYICYGLNIQGRGYENNHIYLQNGVVIERNVSMSLLDNTCIEIGQDTFIGSGVCFSGPGNISIGKRCLISAQSGIYANNYNFIDMIKFMRERGINCQGIIIEDDCCLGYGVKVLDGVTIGRNSIISAGVIVTQNIPPFSRVTADKGLLLRL